MCAAVSPRRPPRPSVPEALPARTSARPQRNSGGNFRRNSGQPVAQFGQGQARVAVVKEDAARRLTQMPMLQGVVDEDVVPPAMTALATGRVSWRARVCQDG